jgi:hypothetical protein
MGEAVRLWEVSEPQVCQTAARGLRRTFKSVAVK